MVRWLGPRYDDGVECEKEEESLMYMFFPYKDFTFSCVKSINIIHITNLFISRVNYINSHSG